MNMVYVVVNAELCCSDEGIVGIYLTEQEALMKVAKFALAHAGETLDMRIRELDVGVDLIY